MHLTAITVLLALLLEVSKTALSCSLSSYLTLVQTQYTLDFSFSTQTIPSGTVPTLSLSSRYRIEPSSLSACSFKATSASVYSSCSCLPSSNSTATTVTFPDVYSSALSSQNSLSLKVTLNHITAHYQQPLGSNHRVRDPGARLRRDQPGFRLRHHPFHCFSSNKLQLDQFVSHQRI